MLVNDFVYDSGHTELRLCYTAYSKSEKKEGLW